jgi:transposase
MSIVWPTGDVCRHQFLPAATRVRKDRQGQQLEDWMQRVQQSTIREMQNFVEKLRQDRDAVQAGLRLKWSNGVVEGHVNRLKCLKRTMYGRAKFDVLRQRVLYRSPSPSFGSFHEMGA